VVVAFVGVIEWMLVTPLLRRWLGTGLTLLVLTLVLSCLLALVLDFELQVGGSENIWLYRGWFYGLMFWWYQGGTSLLGMVNKDVGFLKDW
jgi:hypothetical protein